MSMQKRYRFAGLEFQIEMPEDCAYKDEWNLAFFRTDAVQDPHRCWFEYVDELTVPSGNCCLKQPNFEQYLSPTGQGNGNPFQCSCLENPRDGEPGELPSMGSHRVGHN